jgi:purine-binding chemotaxis protein CheW
MNDKAQSKSTVDARQILRARARALARTPEPDHGAAASLAVLEFGLGGERYAVETRYVTGVMPLKTLTPLPCTPPFVAGIVNVRGRIVMVLDLKKFFGLPESGLTDSHRIIHIEGNGLEVALLADVSIGMRSVAFEGLQAPLPTLSGIRADYLQGITGDPLMVIDMSRILADPDIIVHEEVDKEA